MAPKSYFSSTHLANELLFIVRLILNTFLFVALKINFENFDEFTFQTNYDASYQLGETTKNDGSWKNARVSANLHSH